MKFKVSRADMWAATIEDQPGGAARVLDPVAKAGANFEFAFARRAPEMPGKGLLFVLPVKGAKVLQAIKDEPYGRICKLEDPFGHTWFFSTSPASRGSEASQ